MSYIFRIKNHYTNLTENEKNIANYILTNSAEVKKLTSSNLSEDLNVSQSSIIKFCKKIGYDGYTEFKNSLIASNRDENQNFIHNEISITDSPKQIVEKIAYESKTAIDSTISINDIETLNKTVSLIEKANRVFVFGLGASNLVAYDFAHKLLKLNKTTLCDVSSHFQLANSTMMTEEDLAFVISFSGETKEVILISEEAKKRNTKIISLTKLAPNTVSSLANVNLYSAVQEGMFRSSAISSRIAQLTVIDILFLMYSLNDTNTNLKYIKDATKIIKDLNK